MKTLNDITWHTDEPEKAGTILVEDTDGYLDIWTWCPFLDLRHPAGWYDIHGEPVCGEIKQYARITKKY